MCIRLYADWSDASILHNIIWINTALFLNISLTSTNVPWINESPKKPSDVQGQTHLHCIVSSGKEITNCTPCTITRRCINHLQLSVHPSSTFQDIWCYYDWSAQSDSRQLVHHKTPEITTLLQLQSLSRTRWLMVDSLQLVTPDRTKISFSGQVAPLSWVG